MTEFKRDDRVLVPGVVLEPVDGDGDVQVYVAEREIMYLSPDDLRPDQGQGQEQDGAALRKGIRDALGIDDDVTVSDEGLIADVQDRVRQAHWCHDEHGVVRGRNR